MHEDPFWKIVTLRPGGIVRTILTYYRLIIYVFSHFVLCFGPQSMMSQFLLYKCINYMHQVPESYKMCYKYFVARIKVDPSTSHQTVTCIGFFF